MRFWCASIPNASPATSSDRSGATAAISSTGPWRWWREAGKGVIVYMHQEGRGIGLVNKIRAYELQEKGRTPSRPTSSWDSRPICGITASARRSWPIIGVRKMRLLTNNPKKIVGLEGYGITITERVPIVIGPTKTTSATWRRRNRKMGHILKI